jgi:peptidoglycan/LPS O-acetylase OafA/YrhL
MSDTREYVAALTGLRGIAAFWVFLFHFPVLHPGDRMNLASTGLGKTLQDTMDMGFAGVYLFFVLSGFLLTLPFAKASLDGAPQPKTGPYFKRRVLRVFPAYWAQLFIILMVGSWFVSWRDLNPGELISHLFMFLNLGPEPVQTMVSVWWTLPVELSFYLLLPVLALVMRPGRWFLLLVAAIFANFLYLNWATMHFGDSVYKSFLAVVQLPGTLPLFLLGASGALLARWMAVNRISQPSFLHADVLFLFGAIGSVVWLGGAVLPNMEGFYIGHWSLYANSLVLGLMFTLMVLGLFWGSRIGKSLCANPVVYYTGLVSYSLYLWHFPVMQQVQAIGGESYAAFTGPVRFVICALAVMIVASLSYFAFERPFFRLRGKRDA